MNYDVLMGFLALILLILWYAYGLRQYLKLKDKNKRLKEKLQRCNCNIKIPSILEMAHKPIIMDIKGELLPHLTESYRKSKLKE
ncbi:hypothetical protein CEP77_04595 [Helicobacter pylori]|uniref:Uncharacterized protein n=1 Tax=Helicobacter pylori TaxID=210 RepID=A0A060CZM4_HELPX|nr:hypothetical protein [Helicobacter pylori]AIA98913.1 hypothetical protein ATCC43526_ICEHptfs3_19 [Helicobacter pylori]AVV96947.1 hypothetical protein CEP77_04595 [Helicobacter pylori]WQV70545.1 hypothetical protein KVK71_01345 [Helicobacter pylori]WQX24873.1 hypothetical protein E5P66_07275 [Helicobacter pylori]WQX27564.1 hypothetical protein E5P64_06925 [Helicobacter pylori]